MAASPRNMAHCSDCDGLDRLFAWMLVEDIIALVMAFAAGIAVGWLIGGLA